MARTIRLEPPGQRSDAPLPSKLPEDHPIPRDATSDHQLLTRCRAGDMHAFEELYRRHSPRLYNVARRMSATPADAEDLLQEIFLRAHQKLATYRAESSVGTWLYRLAVNCCLDHVRSRAARNAAATGPLDDNDASGAASGYTAGAVTPTRLDLERAIGRLPDGCRAAFLLHDVEGLDHREVGEVLGIAEGTSKSQVHKARLRIRAYLLGGAGEPESSHEL